MFDVMQVAVPALIGAAMALLTPWARWGVEKRRLQFEERRRLIEGWREMIADFNTRQEEDNLDLRGFLEKSHGFYSLKPHLSSDFRINLYRPRTIYFTGESSIHPLAHELIDEIGRIERKWKLV